jgi:hypothetical protein
MNELALVIGLATALAVGIVMALVPQQNASSISVTVRGADVSGANGGNANGANGGNSNGASGTTGVNGANGNNTNGANGITTHGPNGISGDATANSGVFVNTG